MANEPIPVHFHTVQQFFKLNRDADYTQKEMEYWTARYHAQNADKP